MNKLSVSIPQSYPKSADQKGSSMSLKIDNPSDKFSKGSNGLSKQKQSEGTKRDKQELLNLANGQAASIGKAPTSRVYTNDYQKVGKSPDNKDITSVYLGNPLKL